MSDSMVYLGFDYGIKRIGIAVGQKLTCNATALETLDAVQGQPNWEKINTILKEWKPHALVVGLPLNMQGSEHTMTRKSRQFAQDLQKRFSLPVFLMDERLSSIEAEKQVKLQKNLNKYKKNLDMVSAKLILQSWLQQQS